MNKLRKILEDFITEDDKGRNKVKYDLGKTISKYENKIRNLKLQDIIGLIFLICFISFTKPCQAVTKCHKDVCVGQEVLIINGLYKNNLANIYDIIKVKQSDDDAEQIRDSFKYFAYLYNGYTVELYRDELKIKE